MRGRRAGGWAFRTSVISEPRDPAWPNHSRSNDGEFQIVVIVVRDNNVDQALKALKKKMQREGVFREMKARTAYEKPSEAKARRKGEAVRRARKLARKRAQREGAAPETGFHPDLDPEQRHDARPEAIRATWSRAVSTRRSARFLRPERDQHVAGRFAEAGVAGLHEQRAIARDVGRASRGRRRGLRRRSRCPGSRGWSCIRTAPRRSSRSKMRSMPCVVPVTTAPSTSSGGGDMPRRQGAGAARRRRARGGGDARRGAWRCGSGRCAAGRGGVGCDARRRAAPGAVMRWIRHSGAGV